MNLPDKICWSCCHAHDGTYAQNFCSASCRAIYRIRKKLGLWVFSG